MFLEKCKVAIVYELLGQPTYTVFFTIVIPILVTSGCVDLPTDNSAAVYCVGEITNRNIPTNYKSYLFRLKVIIG